MLAVTMPESFDRVLRKVPINSLANLELAAKTGAPELTTSVKDRSQL
jgi:hypothetical protein